MSDTKQWLSMKEVAQLLNLRIETVSRAYHEGRIKGAKFGRVYRFHLDDLDELRQYHPGLRHTAPVRSVTHARRRTACHSLASRSTPPDLR